MIQADLLVSSPCEVDAFRGHIAAYEGSWLWWLLVERLSPIELEGQLPPPTSIRLVTGSSDSIALPSYSFGYVAQLRKRGAPVQVVELANQRHEILLRWEVVAQLRRLLSF